MFLRLGGCNLTCLGCDTPYTWRWSANLPHRSETIYDPAEETQAMEYGDVIDKLADIGAPVLVVTGGEPLLQGARLTACLRAFTEQVPDTWVEVETNGTKRTTRGLADVVNQWNVSPKLSHWGNDAAKAYQPAIIDHFLGLADLPIDTGERSRVIFKFVCRNPADVFEAAVIVKHHEIPQDIVWIMPEGTNHIELLANGIAVRDATLHCGFNFTQRLHVLLWGDQRGV
jgi:7-carboxy-7-deazaguanine synthase